MTDSHVEFQTKVRAFVDSELIPNIADWEEQGEFPRSVHESAYAAGVYGALWPAAYGGTSPTLEEADMYHYFTLFDELGRTCAAGVWASLLTHGIALPPILAAGNEQQKSLVARDIITGTKKACLAITEPQGGSDVANVQTVARRTAEGDAFVVNGQKTFISGGMNADYFVTAVRTGDSGSGGVSLLLIDRHTPGLKTTRLKTQGWHCSTTTTVAFDNVCVPASNLLGKEGEGFLYVMRNFNNERFAMAVQSCRMARCCLEDALRYARLRKTFGKRLADHQVIRHKIMDCGRLIMSTHGMFLPIMAQRKSLSDDADDLAGAVALCKVQATKTFEVVARECSQIFGGKAYLRTGPGSQVERCYREVRVMAVGGGSEEIMLDLASRQAKL